MNGRKIHEDLGRAKTSYKRNDLSRAVYLAISALKELGSSPAPTDTRADYREVIGYIGNDPKFKAFNNNSPIFYQPGKEREILSRLIKFYNASRSVVDEESYETALTRKLHLDHALRDGKKFLAQGKVNEAEMCFADARKFFKDEIAMFAVVAREFMAVGEYVRALGQIREGLKLKPADAHLLRLGDECSRLRATSGK